MSVKNYELPIAVTLEGSVTVRTPLVACNYKSWGKVAETAGTMIIGVDAPDVELAKLPADALRGPVDPLEAKEG